MSLYLRLQQSVGVCSQSKQYAPEHKQCSAFVLIVGVAFYVNLAVSHSGRGAGPPHIQRLGQGSDSLDHYAGNTPELPEDGDTGSLDAQFLSGCSMALTSSNKDRDDPTHNDKELSQSLLITDKAETPTTKDRGRGSVNIQICN